MIASAALLADLKRQLKILQDDLRASAEDQSSAWGAQLREEYRRAQARERTGLSWIEWREGEVAQAAVAWILACVFVRFAEDNGLLAGATRDGASVPMPWLAGPGDGLERAVENEAAFYAKSPTSTSRDWLKEAFKTLSDLPAGRPLVNPTHSAVWRADISASAADALLKFLRSTTSDGALEHDFSDPDLGTRFLGDLYQDLSDYAKKTYALLQTPDFVEEFILDLTLTPAIAEFGLTGLKLIDPACGSGHFLLGAFERLVAKWAEAAPAENKGARVQKALDSIHGVDLNPFAIAIARFRLTIAAMKASGLKSLVGAPAFKYHLAIGDSLLGGISPNAGLDLGDDEYFEYDAEDLREYAGILEPGQYHVVVANPPYITPPDATLRDRYRSLYKTCHGKYALSVPFMELLFRLAKRPNGGGAGYVGQITSNSFMKREFGRKLIEQFLSGEFTGTLPEYIDLNYVIDTSGAYIPGHGTPTVILVGRPRKPMQATVRAVLGVRGEPGQPVVAAQGRVWRDIVAHFQEPGYDGPFVSVADAPRPSFAAFPWSLSGGGASELKARIELASTTTLAGVAESLGITSFTLEDDVFVRPQRAFTRLGVESVRPMVLGDQLRDWAYVGEDVAFFAYDSAYTPDLNGRSERELRSMWPYRTNLYANVLFGGVTKRQAGMEWTEFGRLTASKLRTPLSITFAFVATHNHFVLDRGGKVFKQSAPVIKLPDGATEDDHFDLLGVLNSSTACFWLKQVSHNKGGPGGGSSKDEKWRDFYEFTGTKLQDFPLPLASFPDWARLLDELAQASSALLPAALASPGSLQPALRAAGREWERIRGRMIAVQEELDWAVYNAYGLTELEALAPGRITGTLRVGERPVEIMLARRVATAELASRWFDEFASVVTTDVPGFGDVEYRALIEKRLAEIETNANIRLLETPDFKRKWETPGWDRLVADAVRDALLDRLESPELWHDPSGRPLIRSVAQLADDLRHDERLRELLEIHTGTKDYDLAAEVGRLIEQEAVPSFAPLRYKESGLEKFRAWEHTWQLQRAEDRGERVEVPVPPKYAPGDFLKTTYWSARGKLDVPKERFIAFPGSRYPEDATQAFGWAGWDHAERGQATARFANDLARSGAVDDEIKPLVGALIEIEPWLKQWHDEIDPRSGVSPAAAVASIINSLLDRLSVGRDGVLTWRPAAPARGRRSPS